MVHFMKLKSHPFNKIKCGDKIFELRLYDEKRRKISVGDTIEFINIVSKETLKVQVLSLNIFKNFEELYLHIPKTSIGYEEDEIANASDMEEYYSKEEQEKFKVVAIEIKII